LQGVDRKWYKGGEITIDNTTIIQEERTGSDTSDPNTLPKFFSAVEERNGVSPLNNSFNYPLDTKLIHRNLFTKNKGLRPASGLRKVFYWVF